MNQPTHIRAEAPHSSATHDTTEQFAYRAHALDKVEMVSRILQADGRGATMIFTRTKRTAQKVADELAERGFKVGAVHGDLGQVAREKALKAFRTGEVDVLVATDVAARGIDIDDITHVINYQIPEDEQAYVHRIGRTGRAGKTGIAVTLVDWDELPRWTMIDKALGLNSPDPAETYSSSPHLYDELEHSRRAPTVPSAQPRSRPPSVNRAHPGKRAPRSRAAATARVAAPVVVTPPPCTSRAPRPRPPATTPGKPPPPKPLPPPVRPTRAAAAGAAVRASRPRKPRQTRAELLAHGQTGTPEAGRHHCRPRDRTRGGSGHRPHLVDQRRPRDREPARERAREAGGAREGRPGDTAATVGRAQRTHDHAGGRRRRGDRRRRPHRDRPRSGDRPGPVDVCARPRTVRCLMALPLRGGRLSGWTRLRTGQHGRRFHGPARIDAQRLCRQARRPVVGWHHRARGRRVSGWSCGARTWCGSSATARSTRG